MGQQVSVIVQGGLYPWTEQYLRQYAALSDDVIYSGWTGTRLANPPAGLRVVLSEIPANPGMGNRNCQIVSSLAGAKLARHPWAVKVRSDMFLPEFGRMAAHVEERHAGPGHDLFTLSIYTKLPLHPRDHVVWGRTQDLIDLFDIPHDPTPGPDYDEGCDLRSETYLGMWYYARYFPEAQKFVHSPHEYLTDNAPRRAEALAFHREHWGRLFKPFPRVLLEWPKHYPDGTYPWARTKELYGESTAEDLP